MTAPTDRAALEKAIAYYDQNVWAGAGPHAKAVIAAARAHLDTLPRTKMVEVWHVEWVLGSCPMVQMHMSRAEAERVAGWLAEEPHRACRITGPHLHEVPA